MTCDLSIIPRHVAVLSLALEVFCEEHRVIFGIEGCEDTILVAAEKLLEELKRERN